MCTPKERSIPCSAAERGVEYPVTLFTHCGVGLAYFAGRYWVIDPAQPEGTNDLFGHMTLVGDHELSFRSEDGHRYAFKPAPPEFKPPPCS